MKKLALIALITATIFNNSFSSQKTKSEQKTKSSRIFMSRKSPLDKLFENPLENIPLKEIYQYFFWNPYDYYEKQKNQINRFLPDPLKVLKQCHLFLTEFSKEESLEGLEDLEYLEYLEYFKNNWTKINEQRENKSPFIEQLIKYNAKLVKKLNINSDQKNNVSEYFLNDNDVNLKNHEIKKIEQFISLMKKFESKKITSTQISNLEDNNFKLKIEKINKITPQTNEKKNIQNFNYILSITKQNIQKEKFPTTDESDESINPFYEENTETKILNDVPQETSFHEEDANSFTNKYVGYNADVTNLTKLIERKLDDSMKNNESKKHKESEKILNQTLEKLYKIHKNNENLFKKNETILSDIICVAKERIIKKIKLLEKYNLNITSYKDINFKKIIELYPILINLTIDNITLFIADEQMKINNDKKKQKSLNRAIDIKKEENKQRKKEKCQNRNKLIKKGILYSTAVAITGVAGYCAVKKPAETGAFLHKTKTFFTTMWQNITNYFTDKK